MKDLLIHFINWWRGVEPEPEPEPETGPYKAYCPFCGSYCGEHDPDQKPIKTVRCPGCYRDLFT